MIIKFQQSCVFLSTNCKHSSTHNQFQCFFYLKSDQCLLSIIFCLQTYSLYLLDGSLLIFAVNVIKYKIQFPISHTKESLETLRRTMLQCNATIIILMDILLPVFCFLQHNQHTRSIISYQKVFILVLIKQGI